MPERTSQLKISQQALGDIGAILEWTATEFGETAVLRYETLIEQALADIVADPERAGSIARPDLKIDGVRTYHLALSRRRVLGPRVKAPRHFVVYRKNGDVVEVARILHDSRDIARNLPDEVSSR